MGYIHEYKIACYLKDTLIKGIQVHMQKARDEEEAKIMTRMHFYDNYNTGIDILWIETILKIDSKLKHHSTT